jgi:hypothetical protein
MTAKQYLRQLTKLELNIRILSEEIEERRSRLTSTAAPILGDRVQTSPKDVFASMMAALADKEVAQADLILTYERMRDEIVAQILGLDDAVQGRVLYERYVHYKRWDVIAEEMNYTVQRIFQIHGNALVAFAVKYLSND